MSPRENFHFPTTVPFTSSSLIEAWLVIRWKLDVISDEPIVKRDDLFPVAVGRFYDIVKDRYQWKTALPINQAPLEITPHVVRYQFRKNGPDAWPLVQIGPGIATINFQSPCSWTEFKEEAMFLRNSVIEAYKEKTLLLDSLTLTYRNGLPFKYSEEDLGIFLENNLNVKIGFPQYVPGNIAKDKRMRDLNLTSSFSVREPKDAEGIVRLATGTKKDGDEESEQVIFDLEVKANKSLPEIGNAEAFSLWLNQAHSICHEWFMSLIEGSVFERFTQEREEE